MAAQRMKMKLDRAAARMAKLKTCGYDALDFVCRKYEQSLFASFDESLKQDEGQHTLFLDFQIAALLKDLLPGISVILYTSLAKLEISETTEKFYQEACEDKIIGNSEKGFLTHLLSQLQKDNKVEMRKGIFSLSEMSNGSSCIVVVDGYEFYNYVCDRGDLASQLPRMTSPFLGHFVAVCKDDNGQYEMMDKNVTIIMTEDTLNKLTEAMENEGAEGSVIQLDDLNVQGEPLEVIEVIAPGYVLCKECKLAKPKADFSAKQIKNPAVNRKCKACTQTPI